MSHMNCFDKTSLRIIFIAIVLLAVPVSYAEQLSADPNDPCFPKQTALFRKLEVLEAWEYTRGDPNILIGVIDNGFDHYHPDLKGQLIPGFYSNGGYHTECFENIAHGTMTTSIIAAKADNNIGMAGLAPNCRILTASLGTLEHEIVILRKKYRKSPELLQKEMQNQRERLENFGIQWLRYQMRALTNAIHYLVDHNVRVINCSIGGWEQWASANDEKAKLQRAFSYAEEKDVIIVISAGNSAIKIDSFPVSSKLVLIVGASLLNDTRWEVSRSIKGQTMKFGSNFGSVLDVVAPIDRLQVCVPHDERMYNIQSGPYGATNHPFRGDCLTMPNGATSEAAPIVTSLIALCYSVNPEIKARSIIDLIKNNCDDIGDPGVDIYTGYGRINFRKTIESAK
ncbi:S8 family serine peptidase [Planctomycetota bacterium]